MFYREYPPPPALKDYIQCFWALEHDYRDPSHTHEHLWADTHIELIFSYGERYYRQIDGARTGLPANFVIGPFKKELLLYSDGLTGFVAVRFHPWGFAAFPTIRMTELINVILPAGEVLDSAPNLSMQTPNGPGEIRQVQAKLEILKNWLTRQPGCQQERQSPVPEVARAVKARKGVVKISELSEVFGLNPRRLERLFMSEIGRSAKLFARILRFNHAKGLIERDPDISLASLTYETGYADQAHFSHNFREMFGYTPAQFKALMRGVSSRHKKICIMITKIGTVGVYVEDQEKALKFWTEKVGFVEKDRKDMGNGKIWLEVAPPNAESALVLYPKGLMPDFAELKPSIVFMCDDIDAFCAGLKQKGVRFEKELMNLGWGKFASFLDEDGNKYGLKG